MMDHRLVPGVLLLSRPLGRPARSIVDLPGSDPGRVRCGRVPIPYGRRGDGLALNSLERDR